MKILGVACAVPKTVVENRSFAGTFGEETVERIVKATGVERRRVAPKGVCASDLCVAAAESLFERENIDRETIDALLFVSQTADFALLPQTAPSIQARLGLSSKVFSLDFKSGCSGYPDGLVLAKSLIDGGGFRRVCLLVGDTLSKITRPDDQGTALLFGDAGSATLLEAFDGDDDFFVRSGGSDGTGWEVLKVDCGARLGMNASKELVLDGAKVFSFTIDRVPPMIKDLLGKANWAVTDVDCFIFHQANAYILNYLARKSHIAPDRLPTSLADFGNTSSASIPLTMVTRLRDRLKKGSKIVLVGFGVGLLWSAVALEWGNVPIAPLVEL